MKTQNNENMVKFAYVVPEPNARSSLIEKLRKYRLEHLHKKVFYQNTKEKSKPLYIIFDKCVFVEIYLELYKRHINSQLRYHNFKLTQPAQALKLIFEYFGEEPPCV